MAHPQAFHPIPSSAIAACASLWAALALAAPAHALDLNAQWLDSSGYRVDVVQDGNEIVALTTEGPNSGPWKRAEGRVRGQNLRLDVEGNRFEGRVSEGFDRIRWSSGAVWVRIPESANPGDLMRRLQAAVAGEQPLEVASLVEFPVELRHPEGEQEIADTSALQKRLPGLFDRSARADLAVLDPYGVARSWPSNASEGTVELGRTRLSLVSRCAEGDCPPGDAECSACTRRTWRIGAAEILPAGPDSVAGLFGELRSRLRSDRTASIGELIRYPIDVQIDGQPYALSEPAHFSEFASAVFDRTRDDLLEVDSSAIDDEGRVRVRNGLFTLEQSCVGETALECAAGDAACETQRRSEQCRKREPRIAGIEIFSQRQYTRTVADLRSDLVASGMAESGGRASRVTDAAGSGAWLFLSSSEERPVAAADGIQVTPLAYGDAPAGPHQAGSLRDVSQAAAFEFPALSTRTLLDGATGPDANRGEVAVHPGPLELPEGEGSARPYLVIRWVSGAELRFVRVVAQLRRADSEGDGITITATAPDGRNAQALLRRPAERELAFELDRVAAGQTVDLAIGPRGSADSDMLLVAMRVEAIEVGASDRAATNRALQATLGAPSGAPASSSGSSGSAPDPN